MRTLWHILKYSLAAFGAYLLIALWTDRWGLWTTIWLLAGPFAFGAWEEWQRRLRWTIGIAFAKVG